MGCFAGLLAGAFLSFLIVIFEVQFDVLIPSSVQLAHMFIDSLHFRDWLPPAGTSWAVTEMKLL